MPITWEEFFQQEKISDTTRNLLDSFFLDTWPTKGAVADFGITSQEHYAALKYSIILDEKIIEFSPNEEVFEQRSTDEMQRRIIELEGALWNSKKLTAFVQKYAPERYSHVVFNTGLDDLLEIQE